MSLLGCIGIVYTLITLFILRAFYYTRFYTLLSEGITCGLISISFLILEFYKLTGYSSQIISVIVILVGAIGFSFTFFLEKKEKTLSFISKNKINFLFPLAKKDKFLKLKEEKALLENSIILRFDDFIKEFFSLKFLTWGTKIISIFFVISVGALCCFIIFEKIWKYFRIKNMIESLINKLQNFDFLLPSVKNVGILLVSLFFFIIVGIGSLIKGILFLLQWTQTKVLWQLSIGIFLILLSLISFQFSFLFIEDKIIHLYEHNYWRASIFALLFITIGITIFAKNSISKVK